MTEKKSIIPKKDSLAIKTNTDIDTDSIVQMILANPAYKDKFKSEAEIVTTLVLGAELGFSPMTSLEVCRNMSPFKIMAIKKGKVLGIDPAIAIDHIHPIETKQGITYTTDIHIVNAKLTEAGVQISIIEDAKPLYLYRDTKKMPITQEDYEANTSLYQLLPPHLMSTAVAMIEGREVNDTFAKLIDLLRIPITIGSSPYVYNNRTTVELYRPSTKTKIRVSYTYQQAREAGLLVSYDDKGNVINAGKSNWNLHPATMNRNRTIAIPARIIASDYLQGLILPEEFIDGKIAEEPAVYIEEIKD